jgi:hypothetical protein
MKRIIADCLFLENSLKRNLKPAQAAAAANNYSDTFEQLSNHL